MASEPERIILTYDDLVALPNDRNRYELFEGELQVTAAPNTMHQMAVRKPRSSPSPGAGVQRAVRRLAQRHQRG